MSRRTYHVTPKGDAWRVLRAGAARADSVHSSKSKAIARAKELAKKRALGQVKVHGQDGGIQTEHTFGKDPRRFAG